MKYLLLTLALLPQWLLATDAKLVRSSIVKIVSTLGSTSKELKGSGLLFIKDGKRYILTSDHVVAHTNAPEITHTAKSAESGESLTLKFLASEWGMGLALMEVQNDSAGKIGVPYEELVSAPAVKAGDRANLMGYPYESEDLTEESQAKVLNPEAPVPFFVFVPTLVEFEALIGEFGMSGGAAFTPDQKFAGVLAYQRILEGEVRQNRVYTIPANKVAEWLRTYFAQGDKFIPTFSEPWWGQANPDQIMLTNDGYFLAFRLFKGDFRMLMARLEALIVLSDGPSIRYTDSKKLLDAFRKKLDEEIYRPCEFGLFDREKPAARLVEVKHAAEAIRALDLAHTTLFVVRGERHEERFARYKPAVDGLSNAVAALEKAGAAASKEVIEKLQGILKNCAAIPSKPTVPGPEGASEFFSFKWVGGLTLDIEHTQQSAAWNATKAALPAETANVARALTALSQSLNSFELRSR